MATPDSRFSSSGRSSKRKLQQQQQHLGISSNDRSSSGGGAAGSYDTASSSSAFATSSASSTAAAAPPPSTSNSNGKQTKIPQLLQNDSEQKKHHPHQQDHYTRHSTRQHRHENCAAAAAAKTPSPNSKRRKVEHGVDSLQPQSARQSPPSPSTSASTLTPSSSLKQQQPRQKAASTEAMYSFPSSQHSNGSALVDIAGSPNTTSPRARRVSNTARLDSFAPQKGPQKLKVKNLRTTKTDSDEFCSRTIKQLEAALSAIFQNRAPAQSNEELYRGAENVCRLGKAPELAGKLFEKCKEHIVKDMKTPLVASAAGAQNVDVLRSVLAEWATWNAQSKTIRAIFFYLDRAYLLQSKAPSIHDLVVAQFRNHVFSDPALSTKILDGACELLQGDRTGTGVTTKDLFAEAIKLFHDLAIYTTEFEPLMLGISQFYIADWSEKEVQKPLFEYVAQCEKFIDEEMKRCVIFDLDGTSRRALLNLLEDHLIERKMAELTNVEAVAELLNKNSETATKELKSLFSLLERRRLGVKLKGAFGTWVDETGTAIVFDEKDQDSMVVRLLELKVKLDHIWRFSFRKNEAIGHTLRESFEAFMNKSKKSSATWNTDNSKPGEMIAKYVDILLKAGAKAIPTSLVTSTAPVKPLGEDEEGEDNEAVDEDFEVNAQLDQVLDLFRFVHGKAVFEAFYKKDLARRLLMGRSASSDAERSMLTRLKTECGAGFTQNLEQMFKDIELSREEMSGYKGRFEQTDGKQNIDLNVSILSAAAWPTYPDVPVTIPLEIKKILDHFEKHYNMKHSGRKLSWKHALAHCQLKASFPRGNKEIVVSSFQAIVLLLFNSVGKDEHLSYEHIKAETGLSEAEVKRTLQSLACAKLRPLTKHPKGREVNETDTFTVNSNFNHEKYRVKINAIQLKETKEENKETHVRVAADRQFETQAAIVRIMKSRKTITHAELVSEVISATKSRGTLNVADIKKNIDKLIEKEYMERHENNSYGYLA